MTCVLINRSSEGRGREGGPVCFDSEGGGGGHGGGGGVHLIVMMMMVVVMVVVVVVVVEDVSWCGSPVYSSLSSAEKPWPLPASL